jgi:hypothetical protein
MTLAERDRPCRVIGAVPGLGAGAVPAGRVVLVIEMLALKDFRTGRFPPNAVGNHFGQDVVDLALTEFVQLLYFGQQHDPAVFVQQIGRKEETNTACQHGIEDETDRGFVVSRYEATDEHIRIDDDRRGSFHRRFRGVLPSVFPRPPSR